MLSLLHQNKRKLNNITIIGSLKRTLYGDIIKTDNKVVFVSMDCILYKQGSIKIKNKIVMRRLGHVLFSNGHMLYVGGNHQSGYNDLVRWTQTFFVCFY